jgi:hypothetical protein
MSRAANCVLRLKNTSRGQQHTSLLNKNAMENNSSHLGKKKKKDNFLH